MPIFLRKEFETEIVGHGDGFISINQKNDEDEIVIWLSVRQFQDICNHQDLIVDEAFKSEQYYTNANIFNQRKS